MRKILLAGNWKMHKKPSELAAFFKDFADKAELSQTSVQQAMELLFAVPYVSLQKAAELCRPLGIQVAAQNVHQEREGAYTGEIAASMLKDIGVGHCLVGHSERRQYFAETDEQVGQKAKICLDHGLKPIVCIGENREQRESSETYGVLERQLTAVFEKLPDLADVTIAYEPVWAIGTGLTASDEQAQDAHQFIRSLIGERYQAEVAAKVRILYGGSMKPENAEGLLSQPDIDGGLVGGASLKADDFAAMARTARRLAAKL